VNCGRRTGGDVIWERGRSKFHESAGEVSLIASGGSVRRLGDSGRATVEVLRNFGGNQPREKFLVKFTSRGVRAVELSIQVGDECARVDSGRRRFGTVGT